MTGRATYGDGEQLRGLWKMVFGDNDRFLDSFFGNLFRPSECLVARDGGTVTSMLFMLEGTVSAATDFPMRYVYACATHPDYRCGGLMGRLLEEAVKYAGKNGFELALVPENDALAAYYGRFGFTAPTHLYIRKYPPFASPHDAGMWRTVADNADAAGLLAALRERFRRGKNAVLWPEAHLRVALDGLFARGGEFLVAGTDGRLLSGYALAFPDGGGNGNVDGGMIKVVECASTLSQDDTVTSLRSLWNDRTTLFSLSSGVAISCSDTPYGLFHTPVKSQAPYLNLALDI